MQDFEILCNLNIWTLIFSFFIIAKFDCNLIKIFHRPKKSNNELIGKVFGHNEKYTVLKPNKYGLFAKTIRSLESKV